MCTLYTYLYLCEHEQLTRRATHIAVVAAALVLLLLLLVLLLLLLLLLPLLHDSNMRHVNCLWPTSEHEAKVWGSGVNKPSRTME